MVDADKWEWSAEEWEIVCLGHTPDEFDFFARDLDGRVAMLSSYNTGPSAYDNGTVHHPQQPLYERVACPTLPLVVEDIGLDDSLRPSLPLIEARFSREATISFDRIPR